MRLLVGPSRPARLQDWVVAVLRGDELWWLHETVVVEPRAVTVATLTASFEGQTDGTGATTGNSSTFGDTAMAAVTANGGTIAYETSQAAHGAVALQMTQSAGTPTNTCFIQYTDGSTSTSGAFRIYLYLTGSPAATMDFPIRFVSSANATVATIQMTSGRVLRISAGSSVQGTVAVALNTWYRLEIQYANITGGSGTLNLQSYVGDSASAADSIGLTGLTLSAIQGVRLGKLGNQIAPWYFDDFAWVTGSSTPLGPAGVDATATPAAVARSVVVPSPAIQAGATMTPAAVARAAAVPAPVVSTGVRVTPASVAGAATIYPFDATIDATVDVASVSRLVAVPAPSLSVGVTLNPDVLAGRATSVGDPVLDNYFIALDADAADIAVGEFVTHRDAGGSLLEATVFQVVDVQSAFGFSNIFVNRDFGVVPVPGDILQVGATSFPAYVPEPTVTATTTVAAAAVARAAVVPAPTVQASSTVAASAVSRAAVVGSPTVTAGAAATPVAVAAVAAVPAPGLQTGSNATVPATSVAAVAAVPAATVSTGQTVTASSVARSVAVPAPTLSAGSTTTPAAVAAVAAVPTPMLGAGIVVTPAAVSSPSIVIGQPSIRADQTVTPASVARAAVVPAPTMRMSATVQPDAVFGFASQVPSSVFAQQFATVPAATVAAVAAVPAPVPAMSTEPVGIPANGTAFVPIPVIRCSATLNGLFTVSAVAEVPPARARAKRAGGSLNPAGGVKVRRVPTLTGGVR